MSTYFNFWEAKHTQREYEYLARGKIIRQLENEVECIFCYKSGKDMVGQHTTGGNTGICLECFRELKNQEKLLKENKNGVKQK